MVDSKKFETIAIVAIVGIVAVVSMLGGGKVAVPAQGDAVVSDSGEDDNLAGQAYGGKCVDAGGPSWKERSKCEADLDCTWDAGKPIGKRCYQLIAPTYSSNENPVSNTENTCEDSDEHLYYNNEGDIYVKGYVSGYINGQYISKYEDSCVPEDAGPYKKGQLLERGCAGNKQTFMAITCPSGYTCSDGACTKTKESEINSCSSLSSAMACSNSGCKWVYSRFMTNKGYCTNW